VAILEVEEAFDLCHSSRLFGNPVDLDLFQGALADDGRLVFFSVGLEESLRERMGRLGGRRPSGACGRCQKEGEGDEENRFQGAATLVERRLFCQPNSLTSDGQIISTRGSACKRLLMYLRWMVRKDEVDPGGWEGIPPSKLLVPVDTHMHRIARKLRFTRRKQANLATVREITAAFRKIVPDDPARYDFTLTRFGIRKDLKSNRDFIIPRS